MMSSVSADRHAVPVLADYRSCKLMWNLRSAAVIVSSLFSPLG